MFSGIGPLEIIIIAGALLLLFGARRIPEIARGLGSGIRNFKGSLNDPGSDSEPQGDEDPSLREADEPPGSSGHSGADEGTDGGSRRG